MISNITEQNYKSSHTDEYYMNIDHTETKKCSLCKKDKTLDNFSKHRKQKNGFNYECKVCAKHIKLEKGINLTFAKSRAKKRNIDFNITQDDLFLPKYCPILNIKIDYDARKAYGNSPSIDRIDNSKGYIKGNVIIMSRLANAMKSSATFNELRLFSTNINKLIDHYEKQGALGNITDIFYKNEEFSLDF
jgi:hypothetical protein